MAAPAGVTPKLNFVIIEPIDDVFSIKGEAAQTYGLVDLVGPNVLNVAVGENVLFSKGTGFSFSDGDDTWYSVRETDIEFNYVPV